jgi:long-subunit acyl-CoA synthetase (AMP-forming)
VNAGANAAAATTAPTCTNIHTINGTNIQNQNVENQTNNNNTVINLVVYNPNASESIQFNHAHIDPKKLKKFFIPGDIVKPERLTDIVREWTQQLLANDDNKCVKKTNIRASHSQVHVGNNNWESRLDKEVYPHLMNNIANDFSDF